MSQLQVTTRIGCGVACDYCPQDKLIQAYGRRGGDVVMSLDRFRAYLESVPGDVEVWFAGLCEPWLNPQCTEMLLYAHRGGHRISVFTTLVGLSASDVELLESVPYGFFHIHLPSDSRGERIPVTDAYRNTLSRILRSGIPAHFHCHGRRLHPAVGAIVEKRADRISFLRTYRRSGNVESGAWVRLPRRRGVIDCWGLERNHVLLPNGDVLLCSQDYGMKHVLGNLGSSPFESLFQGGEFRRVEQGRKDASVDILCRHCQEFCRNVDWSAKVWNFPYLLEKGLHRLWNVRSYRDVRVLASRLGNRLTACFRNDPPGRSPF